MKVLNLKVHLHQSFDFRVHATFAWCKQKTGLSRNDKTGLNQNYQTGIAVWNVAVSCLNYFSPRICQCEAAQLLH